MTSDVTVRANQLRIAETDALSAFGLVLNQSAIKARARLRFGPGKTCEQIARLIDTALVRAEESGLDTGKLVFSSATATAAEEIVRVRRKAHGLSDWIGSPTSDVTIVLRPEGVTGPTPEAAPAAVQPSLPLPVVDETPAELAVREVLRGVLDPDLGVNIVDLGFVRRIKVDDDGQATITMTLTSPACPLVKIMTNQMRDMLAGVNTDYRLEWEWQPSWRPADISPAGRAQLEADGFNAFSDEPKGCALSKAKRTARPLNG